jgi:3-hydroxybutyryl-CoA dehydrogenase
MRLLVVGNDTNFNECKSKFGESHKYDHAIDYDELGTKLNGVDCVFDFLLSTNQSQLSVYRDSTIPIFINTTFKTLYEFFYQSNGKISPYIIGFCGLPTFLNRPLIEVSCFDKKLSELILKETAFKLGTEYVVVDDRVGLATPRVICMIINEAFYTVQENTASKKDIDLAMKLGTSYPFGPFEWCTKIGARNVYDLLNAVFDDTRDDRYKICPLLKKLALTIPIS